MLSPPDDPTCDRIVNDHEPREPVAGPASRRHGEVLIVLGDRLEGLRDKCREVELGAVQNHPWAEPWEDRPVLVCRGLKWDLREAWLQLKRYNSRAKALRIADCGFSAEPRPGGVPG